MLKGVYAKSPFITMAFVDGGCNSDEAQRAAFEASRISITVVKRNDKQIKDFVVLPKRWVVERTFGWINRARRLSKNFEATLESALAWFQIALAFLIMRRLARWVRRVSSQVLRPRAAQVVVTTLLSSTVHGIRRRYIEAQWHAMSL
jgi:hypothetical protein